MDPMRCNLFLFNSVAAVRSHFMYLRTYTYICISLSLYLNRVPGEHPSGPLAPHAAEGAEEPGGARGTPPGPSA
jgi:hypothetical protein